MHTRVNKLRARLTSLHLPHVTHFSEMTGPPREHSLQASDNIILLLILHGKPELLTHQRLFYPQVNCMGSGTR